MMTFENHTNALRNIFFFFSFFSLNVSFSQTGCVDSNYNFRLETDKLFSVADDITTTAGNNIFVSNISTDNTFLITGGLIVQNDKQGNIVWAKRVKYTTDSASIRFDRVKELFNGDLFVMGRSYNASDTLENLLIARFDAAGSLLWHHLYKLPFVKYSGLRVRPQQIGEDADGDIYFTFNTANPGYSFIVKIDSNGNIIWSKDFVYNPRGDDLGIVFGGIFIQNGVLNAIGISWYGFVTMQLNKYTGSMLSLKHYATGIIYPDIQARIKTYELNTGHYLLCSPTFINLNYAFVQGVQYQIIDFDGNLNVSRSFIIKAFPSASPPSGRDIIVKPSGEIIYCFPRGVNNGIYLGKIDPSGQLLMQKKLTTSPILYTRSILGIDSSNVVKLAMVYANPPSTYGMDNYYLNPDNKFTGTCIQEADTSFTQLENFSLTPSNFSWERIDDNAIQEQPFPVNSEDVSFTTKQICKTVSICDSLKITGQNALCTGSLQTFKTQKNQNCLKEIKWEFDSVFAKLISKTDSTVTLQFNTMWSGYLKAGLYGCDVKDSIYINVYSPGQAVNLGSDTVYCAGNIIYLRAGIGYKTYQWQDGSTDSVFAVTQPGIYHVTTTDYCGNIYSDTITISKANYPVSLGDDTSVCKSQSIVLIASAGFSKYFWSPPYNISSTSGRTVSVFPEITTTYEVSAEKSPGCIFKDTILVIVKNCPQYFYIPTAFSPNKDGKNDIFRPLISGNLKDFAFTIYNRWGQIVYHSNDKNKGWDGTLNGKKQDDGVFVWSCKYQFDNKSPELKKGTVLLIH